MFRDVQQDPAMMQMMQGMQNPQFRDNIETKLQQLKEDPELASIMADIEQGGPAAMMKCAWHWVCPAIGHSSHAASRHSTLQQHHHVPLQTAW